MGKQPPNSVTSKTSLQPRHTEHHHPLALSVRQNFPYITLSCPFWPSRQAWMDSHFLMCGSTFTPMFFVFSPQSLCWLSRASAHYWLMVSVVGLRSTQSCCGGKALHQAWGLLLRMGGWGGGEWGYFFTPEGKPAPGSDFPSCSHPAGAIPLHLPLTPSTSK